MRTMHPTTTNVAKQPSTSRFTKQSPTSYNRETTIKTSTVFPTNNLTLDVGINRNDKSGFQMSTQVLIIIIVSTVILIMGVISICLLVRKYKLNKS